MIFSDIEQGFKELRESLGKCQAKILNLDEFQEYKDKLRAEGIVIPSKEFAEHVVRDFEFKVKFYPLDFLE